MSEPVFDPTYCASDDEIDILLIDLKAEIRAARTACHIVHDSYNALLRTILKRRAAYRVHRRHEPYPGREARRTVSTTAPCLHQPTLFAGQNGVHTSLDVLAHTAVDVSSIASSSATTLDQQPTGHVRSARIRSGKRVVIAVPSSESEEELTFSTLNLR